MKFVDRRKREEKLRRLHVEVKRLERALEERRTEISRMEGEALSDALEAGESNLRADQSYFNPFDGDE